MYKVALICFLKNNDAVSSALSMTPWLFGAPAYAVRPRECGLRTSQIDHVRVLGLDGRTARTPSPRLPGRARAVATHMTGSTHAVR